MARFYGAVEGGRSRATRCGIRTIKAMATGWNVGVLVDGEAAGEEDRFRVILTAGSSASNKELLTLAEVAYIDGRIYVNGKPI